MNNFTIFEPLKAHIQKHISISKEETDAFCQLFELKPIKKKEFLLLQGDICKIEAFVLNGLFQGFSRW